MSADPASLIKSAATVAEVSSKLGILDKIKATLIKQPDAAAMKLAAVLEELQKTVLAFETEVVKFLALAFAPGPDLRADRATLYSLEGQGLWQRAQSARGHCGKIANIYTNFLNPWFQRLLGKDSEESKALADLFRELSDNDGKLIDLLNQAAWWLGEMSELVLDRVEAGDLEGANKIVAQARKDIAPARRRLHELLASLYVFEGYFIEAGKVA